MVAVQTSRAAIFCATVVLSAYGVAQESAWHDAETRQLVEQLSDPQPEVRQQAFEILQTNGMEAFDVLYSLQDTKCLEQRLAIRRLLQSLELEWTDANVSEPLQQILVDYRRQSAIRRKVLLEKIELSDQPGTVGMLAKLSRYERSDDLSCQAAICLIRYCSAHNSPSQPVLEAIGNSQRKSCVWIRDALTAESASEFAELWTGHLQHELYVDHLNAQSWQPDLLFQLLEWLLPQLLARNQQPAANLISEECVQICPDGLIDHFADLFIRTRAWQALDQLVDRFGPKFNQEPLLLYRIASAKFLRGEPESAFRLIKRAGQIDQPAQSQLEICIALRQLGYSFVAEQVLKHVSLRADCPLPTKIRANLILAQWLSQEDRNAEASRRTQLILHQLELNESEPSILQQLGFSLPQIAAQGCLYEALDCLAHNNLIGCEASILEGLHEDPNHTELLILGHCFQFSDLETSELIRELVQLRQQDLLREIAELTAQLPGPQETNRKSNYNRLELAALANRYAWLTANTTGDQAVALRYARLANELVDRNPYYLDTEAKCCFVEGNVARAIALQKEACRLAPHDLSLQKQLLSFQRFQDLPPIAKIPSRLE